MGLNYFCCCCSGEPMTDQEYGEFVRSPTVIALSLRPEFDYRSDMQKAVDGFRPDNIALRKATFYSMLSYLEFHTGYVPGVRSEIEKIQREIADLN